MKIIRIIGILIPMVFYLALPGQTIEITSYPVYGEMDLLHGKTDVLNTSEYSVACYVFVQEAGGWWGPKPSTVNPLTPIATDGTFTVQFITGGYDEFCSGFFVYLKHDSMPDPPFIGGGNLPDSAFESPYDIVARPHGSRRINWPNNNYQWLVKESIGSHTMGPGGNLFSAEPENVWVDELNQLHLKVDVKDSLYYCAELIADTALGYGIYSFVYNSNPDILDPKTVYGFFTWDAISPHAPNPNDYYREIDFEFSRWGNATDSTNAQFVIQPWSPAGNLMRYDAGTNIGSIHSFAWYKDSIVFESRNPDSSLIQEWVYTGGYLPEPGEENIRINLWLTNTEPIQQDEIILGDYSFQYLLEAPTNVFASDCMGDNILIEWDEIEGCYYKVYRSITSEFANAKPITDDWFQGNTLEDAEVEKGMWYSYWIRCADNSSGSNISGYTSDISLPDSGISCIDQFIPLATPWTGISSYINPLENNLDSLFKQLGNNLIIIQNQNGVYYPEYNMNTLGAWDYHQGYVIKVAEPAQMIFPGLVEEDKVILLSQGWNLIPVLSDCPVEIEVLFQETNLLMLKQVAGEKLWWPDKDIATLNQLLPGSAYFVLVSSEVEIIFPDCPDTK